MTRLFQNFEGEIQELIGKELTNLKCLYDHDSNHLILVWLEAKDAWFRIFIDTILCVVDEYLNDESLKDSETDDDLLIEHTKWVNGLIIEKAIVESKTNSEISMIIELSDRTKLILSCDKNEFCSIKKTE